jgi:hypothetical protein
LAQVAVAIQNNTAVKPWAWMKPFGTSTNMNVRFQIVTQLLILTSYARS